MSLFKSNQKPSSGPVQRPVGLYEGKIIEALEKQSKGGSTYWNLTFEGKHQSGVTTKVFLSFFPASQSEYCQRSIVELLTVLGVWGNGEATIDAIQEITGSPMAIIARFEEDSYNGQIKKRLCAMTLLASDLRTAFEISEGAESPEQYAKDILWVEENPVKVAKDKEEDAF